jgi:hypothetical protein
MRDTGCDLLNPKRGNVRAQNPFAFLDYIQSSVQKSDHSTAVDDPSGDNIQTLQMQEEPSTSREPSTQLTAISHAELPHVNDFGHVIENGADGLSDVEKYRFLTEYYTPPPPPAHEWPAEVRQVKGKQVVRRLNPSIMQRQDCATMAYSPMYRGLFCRYCAIFPPSKPQINNAAFIKKPFLRFSHMFGNGGAVKKHVQRRYHLEAIERAKAFMETMEDQKPIFSSDMSTNMWN